MTALNPATDIPSNIDSLEKLAVWVGMSLSAINLTATALEAPGYSQRVAQSGIFYVEADNKHRALIRLSVVISPDHLASANNIWTYAQPLSDAQIPSSFKTAA
ncbi:hypothetical protein OGM63_24770 [Plectonema radiosum NIES-515]|uniref:Uncharacterized protein n=1 Tax=Plectonema radiosum NIES-515 TaxID=2986073 RepID=A0ABT3B5N4_9CYAN|nr:hypothetical protein [Plectonema radiosum]MCV3216677.1 hypothetical protein [Plectonema radiosum NIES-515]